MSLHKYFYIFREVPQKEVKKKNCLSNALHKPFIEKHKHVIASINFFNLQKMVAFQQGFSSREVQSGMIRQDCMAMADVAPTS